MRTKTVVPSALGKALSVLLVSTAIAMPAFAQKTTEVGKGGGGSPRIRTEWTVAGANISIEYGRPSVKGRDVNTLVRANGPMWRAGSDQPSILTTDKALKFGNLTLQPGRYTINAATGDSEWQIAFGKLATPPQWGIPYRQDLEVGRAPMKLGKPAAPVEMVTFTIEPATGGGTLKLEFGTISSSVPFTVVP